MGVRRCVRRVALQLQGQNLTENGVDDHCMVVCRHVGDREPAMQVCVVSTHVGASCCIIVPCLVFVGGLVLELAKICKKIQALFQACKCLHGVKIDLSCGPCRA